MDRFMRNPVEVRALQWFPPGDARHDPVVMAVTHPKTDCLEDGVEDGAIGESGGKYWVRRDNATAQWLDPGTWIVWTPRFPFIEVLPDELFWQLYSGPI